MLKLEWKINGRRVSPARIGEELGRAIRAEVGDRVKKAVASVRCPVHGTPPHALRFVQAAGDRVSVQYEACCESLKQAIVHSLRR